MMSLSDYVYFEERRPQGTDNMYGLLHAIKNKLQIVFSYHKFWEDQYTQRTVEPYALKEFKNRWYILACDLKDNKVKTFALDRIKELEMTSCKITSPQDFDMKAYFKHSFGIINASHQQPEKVVLSFTPFQGKYVKTLPLHKSQRVLIDNEQECRIELNVHPSYDLQMEILSMGANVKVLEPDGFRDCIVESLKNNLKAYEG